MATTAPARGDDANPLFELVDAATQRLQTADPVAASKWRTGGSIEDPPRVEQVALHSSVLRSPDCAWTLDDAKNAVANAHMLDPLYQQALAFSTHSYCH